MPILEPKITGLWVSPSVKWFVLAWCNAWECYHEKYGTKSASCKMNPKTSFNHLLSENAKCPHSCPSTHIPVATVPVKKA